MSLRSLLYLQQNKFALSPQEGTNQGSGDKHGGGGQILGDIVGIRTGTCLCQYRTTTRCFAPKRLRTIKRSWTLSSLHNLPPRAGKRRGIGLSRNLSQSQPSISNFRFPKSKFSRELRIHPPYRWENYEEKTVQAPCLVNKYPIKVQLHHPSTIWWQTQILLNFLGPMICKSWRHTR